MKKAILVLTLLLLISTLSEAAVVRGKVVDSDSMPLQGVTS